MHQVIQDCQAGEVYKDVDGGSGSGCQREEAGGQFAEDEKDWRTGIIGWLG